MTAGDELLADLQAQRKKIAAMRKDIDELAADATRLDPDNALGLHDRVAAQYASIDRMLSELRAMQNEAQAAIVARGRWSGSGPAGQA
jgi:chromosome segregation ATPase